MAIGSIRQHWNDAKSSAKFPKESVRPSHLLQVKDGYRCRTEFGQETVTITKGVLTAN